MAESWAVAEGWPAGLGFFEDVPPSREEHFRAWFWKMFKTTLAEKYPELAASVSRQLHEAAFEAHEAELYPFLDGHNALVLPKCDCPIRRGWV